MSIDVLPATLESYVLLATSYALVAVVSLWCAAGRSARWLRVGSAFGALLFAWYAELGSIAAPLVLQGALVVLGVAWAQRWNRRRRREAQGGTGAAEGATEPLWHFRLSSLLLALLVTSVWLALVRQDGGQLSLEYIARDVAEGAVPGMLALVGIWAALGAARWYWRLAALLFIPGIATGELTVFLALMRSGASLQSFVYWYRNPLFGWPYLEWYATFYAATWLVATWCWLARWATAPRNRSDTAAAQADSQPAAFGTRRRTAAWVVLVALTLVIVVPPGYIAYLMATPPPPLEVTLPEPNGWFELVAIGKEFGETTIPWDTMQPPPTRSTYRAFTEAHPEFLSRVRAAVELPHHPLLTLDDSFEGAQNLRRVSSALGAMAEHARREGDFDEAAEILLLIFQVAEVAAQHGLVFDLLNAGAFESEAGDALNALLPDLSPATCRGIADEVLAYDARREDVGLVLARDEVEEYHRYGIYGRLRASLRRRERMTQEFPTYEYIARRYTARSRLLAVYAALSAFQLEQGHAPQTLAELVPDYLPAVPRDPFSTGELVYRLKSGGPVVYSIGPDGVDRGGVPPAPGTSEPGDLLLSP